MKRLPVAEHLSHEEIDRRYRRCPDGAEKSRWHVLWLVTRPDAPLSATAAAKLVGFTPAWGRAILKRYNAHGPDALIDGRRDNGADPKLTPDRQAEPIEDGAPAAARDANADPTGRARPVWRYAGRRRLPALAADPGSLAARRRSQLQAAKNPHLWLLIHPSRYWFCMVPTSICWDCANQSITARIRWKASISAC